MKNPTDLLSHLESLAVQVLEGRISVTIFDEAINSEIVSAEGQEQTELWAIKVWLKRALNGLSASPLPPRAPRED